MASASFGALIQIEPSSSQREEDLVLVPPQKAFPRTYHSVPEPVELDSLQWGAKLNGPSGPPTPGHETPSGAQTPFTTDIEASRPASPSNEQDAVDMMQSFSSPPMNRFRMLSVCVMNFGNGLIDAAPGALIPYIEKHYGIGYAVVSTIFVATAIGFISAAFIIDAVRIRLGRAKTFMLGEGLIVLGLIMISCTPPFPVVVVSFLFTGVGMSMGLALGNVFAANLHNSTKMLGAMHGSYGIGGTVGPLIATAMVTKAHLSWSRFYLLPLGVRAFNLLYMGWSFWHYESESGHPLLTALNRVIATSDSRPTLKTRIRAQLSGMITAFKSKTVILGALFIFAYQGAEVSISGWVISFLIATRHGNPSHVGYVSSGFWAGITLGRFLLSHPAHKIGEKLCVYLLVIGATAFQLLVWLVPNVVGDAVAVAIVGLLLGPVYPCATVVFSRAIGRKEQVSSLSVISAFGSSGGAVAPFTTGILAQAAGTFVLHPICIGLFAVMMVCWFGLPGGRKRSE